MHIIRKNIFTKSEGIILPQQGTVSCAPRIRMPEYLLLVLLSAGNQHWNSEVDEYTKTKIKNNYVWLQNLHLLYVTIQFIRSIYQYKALAKRYSQLKPTRAKFTTSMELGIIWSPTWLELAQVGLNLIKLKFSPNLSQVFHRLATLANLSQVVLLSLGDWAVVVRQLNGFLVSGLDLAVPFGHSTDASLNFVTWLELTWVGSTVWPGLS